jgi:serine/threonine protein kinase
MTDTIPMNPEEHPHHGDAKLSDSTRKCTQCGELYSGPVHFSCLAKNSTIREGQPAGAPPTDPALPKGTLDDLPEEAAVHAADISRQLNQYILVRQVGRGGMGAVWKSWDKKLTRWVAIKFLLAEDKEGVDRFEREAKLAARLRHPNIAAIYDVAEAPSREAGQAKRHYLAMEYIDGSTLAEAKLGRPELIELFVKVARAIDSAHKGGVVHRDLKPPNIMVTRDLWPYVMDFGVAKALALDSSLSVSGTVVGTPAYMPPEQAEGRLSAIDGRSDVYSLGATMYSLFLGRPPFDGESLMEVLRKVSTEPIVPPRQIDPNFPPELEAILLKAMARDPKDRYPTAAALANDLARHGEGRKPEAPIPAPPVAPAAPKRGLGIPILVAVILLAAAGAVVVPRFLPSRPPAAATPTPPDQTKVPTPVAPSPPSHQPFRPVDFPTESGTFTLKVAVHPFARIVSITRDGEPVTLDHDTTPLLTSELRLGSYELVLRHPQLGDRTVTIPRSQIKAGKTYEIWGQMGKPALEVKELP